MRARHVYAPKGPTHRDWVYAFFSPARLEDGVPWLAGFGSVINDVCGLVHAGNFVRLSNALRGLRFKLCSTSTFDAGTPRRGPVSRGNRRASLWAAMIVGGGFRQCGFGDLAHLLCALGAGTGVQDIREALRFVHNFDNRRYSHLPWPDLVMRDCPAYLERTIRDSPRVSYLAAHLSSRLYGATVF